MNSNAFILSIGTELTTGEITNRNAAYLSSKLADIGIQVSGHLTVPDDRLLIQDALAFATKSTAG